MSFDEKHPILIPSKCSVSNLIIRERHFETFHAGPKLLEAKLRQKYWITNSKSTIKAILKKCSVCAMYKPKLYTQLMGDLPQERVNESQKPFAVTAIDFAGPIKTKTSKLRNCKLVKSYIVIFVCLATKALYIDAACDLTASSFIAALRRFVSRRGPIEGIYSDNGSNFTAANKILSELSENEAASFNKELTEESNKHGIRWHFSPPRSAHFNGLVEAAVKSTKFHLKRAIKDAVLTFEELSTVLAQIEAILNSRPICELSDDPNDTSILTPAHFLNIASGKAIPDEDLSEVRSNRLTRWQLVQKICQDFWSKWRDEYLNQLQSRSKWLKQNSDIKIGELVMLKDANIPPQKWPLGRVVEKHTGKDGITRVVSVKTNSNILKRGITELAPLPVNSVDEKEEITTNLAILTKKRKTNTRRASRIAPVISALLTIMFTVNMIDARQTSFEDFAIEDRKLQNSIQVAIDMINGNKTMILQRIKADEKYILYLWLSFVIFKIIYLSYLIFRRYFVVKKRKQLKKKTNIGTSRIAPIFNAMLTIMFTFNIVNARSSSFEELDMEDKKLRNNIQVAIEMINGNKTIKLQRIEADEKNMMFLWLSFIIVKIIYFSYLFFRRYFVIKTKKQLKRAQTLRAQFDRSMEKNVQMRDQGIITMPEITMSRRSSC